MYAAVSDPQAMVEGDARRMRTHHQFSKDRIHNVQGAAEIHIASLAPSSERLAYPGGAERF